LQGHPTGYAALLNSGSAPATAIISETLVNSQAKLVAFDNAESITSAHPDFNVLELPNDVVVFDTQLNAGKRRPRECWDLDFFRGRHPGDAGWGHTARRWLASHRTQRRWGR
jgi:hypothetical protein